MSHLPDSLIFNYFLRVLPPGLAPLVLVHPLPQQPWVANTSPQPWSLNVLVGSQKRGFRSQLKTHLYLNKNAKFGIALTKHNQEIMLKMFPIFYYKHNT